MECPYCKKSMKEGDITTFSERLCWTPIGEERSRMTRKASPNGIYLAKLDFWKSKSTATAFYCDHCRKVIINV